MSEFFHTSYLEACHQERRHRLLSRRAARMGEERWLRMRARAREF